jgi:aminoglycoside 6'-N-acetyltransferase I
VRRAGPADLDTIVALRLALLREAGHNPLYKQLRPDAERQARRLFRSQLEAADEVVFLAERSTGGNGTRQVVGVLRCVESWGSPLLEPAQYAYVSSVYVIPTARRSGVLRALLAAATNWSRERGLSEMRLHCVADSKAANAAWDALGFDLVENLRLRSIPP